MPASDSTGISDSDDVVLGLHPDLPAAPSCSDGILNGDETDIDCGGGACAACSIGQACGDVSDCVGGFCVNGVCQAASCTDGIWNGTETDIDCGGACAPCEIGQACSDSSDCVGGLCLNGVCQAASCTDGIWNGTETDIDCGGACAPCEIGLVCTSSSDCASDFCVNGVCQEAPVWAGPVIVPWFEGAIADDDDIARIVNGMKEWQAVTNTVIVSAAVSQVTAYGSLRAAYPSMHIIPALKTSSALYAMALSVDQRGFDSVQGWRIAAAAVREMMNRTGQSVVVLESETAMKQYLDGAVSLDFDGLREGLRLLPQEATYLWYPSAAQCDARLQPYLDVDAVVDEVLDVRFIDHASLWGPSEVDAWCTITAITKLEAIAQEPTVPKIYALGGDPWWPDNEIPWAIDYVEKKWGSHSWAIVYLGDAHWVDGAASITQYLLEEIVQDGQ